jgi:stage V sporulation protein R
MGWDTHLLPPELRELQRVIEGHARDHGLDFYPTIFEVLDYDELSEIASLGGFPVRYPHWRFGMEYDQLSKGYRYGLQKIYEMVINNDPCYAYLLRCNPMVDQKLVMAHVYGHNDFFKNNQFFAHTNRKMMDEMANHGSRVRAIIDREGESAVEKFVDCCLSLENLIDIHSPYIKRRKPPERFAVGPEDQSGEESTVPGRLKSKQYMDGFINPPETLRAEAERTRAERDRPRRYPEEPERDVLLFLLDNAPLKPWQHDILAIIRDEAYYFAPQGQTKIMNEGWASYWHSTIMTRHCLDPSELIDYADHHSGTMAMTGGRLNPYKLGIELFRDIEFRWDRGQFGPQWQACDDMTERSRWDLALGLGKQKIFEVRRVHNDITFIDEFLTPEFCRRHRLFSFGFNDDAETYEIESREFPKIKERLLFSLTNFGQPIIRVRDANYMNRGELYLEHIVAGDVGLRVDFAQRTLENLHRIWMRPVHIETIDDDVPTLLSYDGTDHGFAPLEPPKRLRPIRTNRRDG